MIFWCFLHFHGLKKMQRVLQAARLGENSLMQDLSLMGAALQAVSCPTRLSSIFPENRKI